MNNDLNNSTISNGTKSNGPFTATMHTGPSPKLMSAGSLTGDDVYNHKDEKIGDLKEIMLNMHTGRVSYAVLSFGGFLGMGEKLFAVPWQALSLDAPNKRLILDIDKSRLETAPGFNKDDWPDMANSEWELGIHNYYGTKPYVEMPLI